MKAVLIVFGMLVLTGIVFGFINHYDIKSFDCNEISPIYLKPSELSQASKIADRENVVVVIPEIDQIIARTEILNCPNFEYRDYIRGIE